MSFSAAPSTDRSTRLSMRQFLGDHVKGCLSIARQGESCVLVVDQAALSILNACIGMSELVSLGFRCVVTLESWKEHEAGLRRPSLFPVPAVYYCRSNPKQLRMILDDFATLDERELLAPEDLLERCFPCLLAGIEVEQIPPTYGSCRLLFIPGYPKVALSGEHSNSVAALRKLEEEAQTTPHFARLLDYLSLPDPDRPAECLLEVLPEEDDFFTLQMPELLSQLYTSRRSRFPSEKDEIRKKLKRVAYRLMTLCVALNEYPDIRIRSSPAGKTRGIQHRPMAELVARYLDEQLHQYAASHPEWRPIGVGKGGRGSGGVGGGGGGGGGGGRRGDGRGGIVGRRTSHLETAMKLDSSTSASDMQHAEPTQPALLLICERVDDIGGALAHDWAYQAAITDVLGMDYNQPCDVYAPRQAGRERRLLKKVLLDESDYVWGKIRHLEMADAEVMVTAGRLETQRKDALAEELRAKSDIKGLHALARLQQTGGGKVWDARYMIHRRFVQDFVDEVQREVILDDLGGGGGAGSGGGGEEEGGSGVRKMLGSLGASTSPEEEDASLYRVAALEQLFLSGVYHDGNQWGEGRVRSELRALLASPKLRSEEKARLLIMWMISRPRIDYEERRALMALANLDPIHQHSIHSLKNMAIPLERPDNTATLGLLPDLSVSEARACAKARKATYRQGYTYCDPLIVRAAKSVIGIDGARPLTEEEWPVISQHRSSSSSSSSSASTSSPYDSSPSLPSSSTPASATLSGFVDGEGGEYSLGDEAAMASAAKGLTLVAGARSVRRRGGTEKKEAATTDLMEDEEDYEKRAKGLMPISHTPDKRHPVKGRRIIVFVLGGVTPAEMSGLQRLSKKAGVEIILGSSALIHPRTLLHHIAQTQAGVDLSEGEGGLDAGGGAIGEGIATPRPRADSDE